MIQAISKTMTLGEYMVSEFRENQRIVSPNFPELNLTAEEIFRVGE